MASQLVTENSLDEWVRAHSNDAQGVIVELIYRLVLASCPNPTERRFPLGDSIGQHGPDGYLDTVLGFLPFVPEGRSYWEIGTNVKPGTKATDDYRDLTKAVPPEVRASSSFIFVTPLSGRRGWEYSWKPNAQAKWLETRRKKNEWRSVLVIDGTCLIDWLQQFPAAEVWLAGKMGLPVHEIQTPEQRWVELRAIGEPPPLPSEVFLANREDARVKLAEAFEDKTLQLRIDTRFPRQVVDFVCAYLASMPDEQRAETIARCLVVSGVSAWNAMCAQRERHILVADFDVDEDSAPFLDRARRAGHVVIFGGQPGGIPHPNRATLHNPKPYQIEEALKNAGYKPERARTLAQKSSGNLTSLLRCLQNLSLMPEWAQGTDAAELAIAQLLGAWNENSEGDKLVAEKISGKAYGEWIGAMRELSRRPGTPLTNREGFWKTSARYEAWYALGQYLFDEHLTRLQAAAILVLGERDPKFDLPPEERYLASVKGKTLTYSHALRNGLAESLALLGSHPNALLSCSSAKADTVVVLTLREIFAEADWILWASLDRLLPLLAEAAPGEFLDQVERTLREAPDRFAELFAQEGSGITGGNYMSGLLWALETLAWDADHLARVVLILGELAAIDPGGTWGNRPAASLTTILLPWLPQTCASIERRRAAIAALMRELPEVGWRLLLSLLPRSHQTSMGTRKPAWRESIPQDWQAGVTRSEHAAQLAAYVSTAIEVAQSSVPRLAQLLDRFDGLPFSAQERLLEHLGSEAVTALPEVDRYDLWAKLIALVTKHKRFSDAKWALLPEHVAKIEAAAERLEPTAPTLRYRRLFSERHDLLEEKGGNYEQQFRILDERRQQAIEEILDTEGVGAVLDFAKAVDAPWRVGFALGMLTSSEPDRALLPSTLVTEERTLSQVVGSFVRGRYTSRGWAWVDQLPIGEWLPEQIGQFFAYLPFIEAAWTRSAQFLPGDETQYWTRTNANPYEANRQGLEPAVERLLAFGRPRAAAGCLSAMIDAKQPIDTQQAIRALLDAVRSTEAQGPLDSHELLTIIRALQDAPSVNLDELFRVEWAYLPLLEDHEEGRPLVLERRLAENPDFFCEIIRLVFRAKHEAPRSELSEEQGVIATNAYRLLQAWRIPPGTLPDSHYDSVALTAWLDRVKEACTASGHLDIAMTMAGHVFVYSPADPSGLWINHAAAAALNAKDAGELRNGFATELFNSRGAYWATEGEEEAKLATQYRERAEQVEEQGYFRLATTLREVATSYERDAERERLSVLDDD